ncbi:MAG: condensation domain-containing protein [Oscillospiraceae bacterium]|jgi:hypothetical protein|nr:condensation domain-containing protein [Oscillospiraceae bacterium]
MTYPLTLPQQNIWRLQQAFGPTAAALTVSAVFHRPPDIDRLREALRRTYLQTDAMRLTISTADGEARQHFLPPGEPRFTVMEFRSLRAMRNWTRELAQTPVPVKRDAPLWHAYILRTDGKLGVAFHCHHLMADAWGLYLLARRLRDNLLGGTAAPGDYADFMNNEQAYLTSPRRAKDFVYFEREFALCPRPVYLADKLRPSLAAKRWSTALTAELSRQVDTAAERLGTTSYALFLYALGKAVAELRGVTRLFLGTTVLNRMGRRELDTVGMFVNTAPVLMDFLAGETPEEVIAAHTGRMIGIFRRQRCGYTQLLSALRAKYELDGGLYDVMLNFQNVRMDTAGLGADFEWHFCARQGETLQLHVHDWTGEGVYRLNYDYRTALLGAGDVRRLHRAAEGHLRAVCTGNAQRR